MKSRIAKGVISFTLCIAMVLGNVGYAFASEDVSGNNITNEGNNENIQPTDTPEVSPEVSPTTTPEEPTTPVVIPDGEVPQSPEVPTVPPTGSVSDNDSMPTDSVSDNSVSANSVSGNSLNLPLSEDGKYYVLTKNIEGRSITITLNIPVELFPEATEISFDAVEVAQEVQEKFEEAVTEEIKEDKLVQEAVLVDIKLLVNNEIVEGQLDEKIQVIFSGEEIPTKAEGEEEIQAFYFDEEKETVQGLQTVETTTETGEEAIATEVEHFSAYGVVTIDNKEYDTREEVMKKLGIAKNFAVFAKDFYLSNHMEGNVAVQTIYHEEGGIDMTSEKIVKAANHFAIEVKKQVNRVSNKERTFNFAIYAEENLTSSSESIKTFSITIPSGLTEKSEVVELEQTGVFYLFELDDNNNIIMDSASSIINGETYTTTYALQDSLGNEISNNNELSNIGNTSYIERMGAGSGTDLFTGAKAIEAEVVFGTNFYFDNKDSIKYIKYPKRWHSSYYSELKMDNKISYHIVNGGACIDGKYSAESEYTEFPIDFDAIFGSNASGWQQSRGLCKTSTELAKTTGKKDNTDSGLLVLNIDADELTTKENSGSFERQRGIEKEINNTTDLVVVNVDCTGYGYGEGWGNYPAFNWASELYLGENWGNENPSKYDHVIWNFYETYIEHGKTYYQSFDGKIITKGCVGGTIFAPAAEVETEVTVEGAIIADTVTNVSNEIHEVLLKKDAVKITCNNEQNGTVPVETPVTIEQDKTAQLKDWDKRTYDIDLDVWTNDTISANNDVILVLDRSGSMGFEINNQKKNNLLIDAVDDFIDDLKIGDRVALVSFNTQVIKSYDYLTINSDENRETIKTMVKNYMQYPDGGTRQDKGLEKALDYLKNNKSTNIKSVVLFTDGVPDQSNAISYDLSAYKNVINTIETQANQIRTYNAQLFTIAFDIGKGDSNAYKPWQWFVNNQKEFKLSATEWLEQNVASSGCAYTATADLGEVFKQIGESINSALTITDTIDNRFVLLSEDGKNVYTSKLSSDMTNGAYGVCINGGETKSEITGLYGGATLTADAEGRLVLTWTDVKVKDIYKAKDDASQGGFVRKLHVWAKEDYIGGNAIPTNYGPTSKVTTESPSVEFEYEDGKFPEPKANVKVRFDADRAVTEMFWGEKLVGNKETIKNAVEQFDYLNNKTYEDLLYVGDKENLTYTENGKTVDLYYYENGVKSATPITYSEDIFATTWYSTKTGTEYSDEMTKEKMGKVSEVGNFYLEFAFTGAGDSTYKSKRASTIGTEAYEATSENSTAVGEYEVKIIAGKITIIKNIEGDYSEIDGDPIFTYKIEDVSEDKIDGFTNKTYYKTLRFMNGAGDQLFATITGLPKGEYVISELDTMGFKEVSHGFTKDTNCYTDGDTVYLGYRRSGVESGNLKNLHTFTATIGEMSYKNECNHTHEKLTHTDTVKNTYVINPDGTAWNYKDSQEDVDNDEKQELPYSGSNGNAGNTNSPLKSALLLPSPDTLNGQKENDEPNQENSQE